MCYAPHMDKDAMYFPNENTEAYLNYKGTTAYCTKPMNFDYANDVINEFYHVAVLEPGTWGPDIPKAIPTAATQAILTVLKAGETVYDVVCCM